MMGLTTLVATQPTFAKLEGEGNVLKYDEANDANGGGIWYILNIILTIMTFGVGVLGTLGLIVAGAQYVTAADSPERMAKAKSRIINVLIGLAVYAVMWAALNWLIPGGLFHS